MRVYNKKSKRINPFEEIYSSEAFNNESTIPNFPYIIDVELTNHCNLDCVFCAQQSMNRKIGYMDGNTFYKIADECIKYNSPIRFIRWGEPFLHPSILEYSQYMKDNSMILHITNNGLAIQESHMKRLIDMELDSITFSFQGATKESYELMRNNNKFDKLVDNIHKFIKIRGTKHKPYIQISSTMTKQDKKEDIDKFCEYWIDAGADLISIGKTDLYRVELEKMQSEENKYMMRYLRRYAGYEKKEPDCIELYSKLGIDWDGKIAGCCVDHSNLFTIGNIRDDSIYDVWNKSELLKIFRRMISQKLYKCLTLCSRCHPTYVEDE